MKRFLGSGLDFILLNADHLRMELMRSIRDLMPNLVIVFVSIIIGVSSFFITDTIMSTPKFDPWGEFSIQRVVPNEEAQSNNSLVPGVEHVYSLDAIEHIETTGVKCLSNDQTDVITVGGVVNWYMVVPPGFQFQVAVYEGTSKMNPGCTSTEYTNLIPDEVREEVSRVLETEPYVVMNIQGYTVPYSDGEEAGVRAPWYTENFAFVK